MLRPAKSNHQFVASYRHASQKLLPKEASSSTIRNNQHWNSDWMQPRAGPGTQEEEHRRSLCSRMQMDRKQSGGDWRGI